MGYDYSEKEVFAYLGVMPPEETEGETDSSSTPDSTPRADGQPDTGALERPGEPATDTADNSTAPAEAASDGGRPSMTPQQRRENAERRRQAVEAAQRAAMDRAVEQARQEERDRAKREMAEFFSMAGLTNTITGKPISSPEEYRDWKNEYDLRRVQRDLKAGRLTTEVLETIVDRAVQKAVPAGTAPDTAPGAAPPQNAGVGRAAAPDGNFQARVDAELTEIAKLDPTIKSVEDLLKMDRGREFYELVKRGNNFLDAFKLANFDKLRDARREETAQRAAQAAINSARSKEHLLPSTAKGSGSVPVPPETMALYRSLMPGASEADIVAHYNRTIKELRNLWPLK